MKQIEYSTLPGCGNKGMALITVLLVTALVAVLVVFMTSNQQIEIKRTTNILERDQALLLAEGVVDWAGRLLLRDKRQSIDDNLDESWAHGLVPTAVEGGAVTGYLEDMQGRFNLNNLVSTDSEFNSFSRAQFSRMLEMCNLEPELIDAVIDWLDQDSEPVSMDGREDESYAQKTPAYRTANLKMTNPSELKLVHGFDAKSYRCLSQYLCTLPQDTKANVNTASPFIIASLTDKITLDDATKFVKNRPLGGFISVQDFLKDQGVTASGLTKDFLSVSSNYFMAYGVTIIGNNKLALYSILSRTTDSIQVIQQSINTYQ